jgi:hypothetical protein
MIDTESEPGAWLDAIAHSPCLRVEDDSLTQAIKDVRLGRAQRICKPAHWRVWREEIGVKWERLGRTSIECGSDQSLSFTA